MKERPNTDHFLFNNAVYLNGFFNADNSLVIGKTSQFKNVLKTVFHLSRGMQIVCKSPTWPSPLFLTSGCGEGDDWKI